MTAVIVLPVLFRDWVSPSIGIVFFNSFPSILFSLSLSLSLSFCLLIRLVGFSKNDLELDTVMYVYSGGWLAL